MNRNQYVLRGLLVLALGILLPNITPAQETEAATEAPAWSQLGEVRQGTLFVNRDRVVALALAQNEMLAASGAMTDAAAAEAQGAWRAFLPQVQIAEYFLRSDDALMSFGYRLQNRGVNPATDFSPDGLNNPGETNNFITRFQAMIPIFNGGSGINGKRAANAMSRAAQHKHVRAEETIRFHAIQAFEGLALAAAYETVMEAAVKSAEGHVRQAQSMVDNEMATAADLLQAQVYLSGLQQQLIEVRNMMAIAGENIKLLTAVQTNLPILANTQRDGTAMMLHGKFNLSAATNRSDILARREEANAAGNMVGVATGSMLPHLNMSIQRDLYSLDDAFGSDAKSWTLGVYATWDIFRGMQNISEVKKAKAQKRAARHMVDFETRQAQVQATEALLTANAAHEKVLVALGAVKAAREGLRIVTNQYREGLASMVNLLDTQAAATMAEGNLVQAQHDYQVGLASLEFAGAARVSAAAEKTTTNPAEAR